VKPVMCGHGNVEIDCKFCTTSVAWAIVKDTKGMEATGHRKAVGWARGYLGLDRREPEPEPEPEPES
jgi:hypothetical protein